MIILTWADLGDIQMLIFAAIVKTKTKTMIDMTEPGDWYSVSQYPPPSEDAHTTPY